MQAQAFEDAADLSRGLGGEQSAQSTAAETVEDELSAEQCEQYTEDFREEEVEAAPGTVALVAGGAAVVVQVVALGRGILQRADELEIAPARRGHQSVEVGQAVDRLLQRGHFAFGAAILVLHLAVVTEKRDVVRGRLDPQDAAAAIIHLERLEPEVMADAG